MMYQFDMKSGEEAEQQGNEWYHGEANRVICPSCQGDESPSSVEPMENGRYICHECLTRFKTD